MDFLPRSLTDNIVLLHRVACDLALIKECCTKIHLFIAVNLALILVIKHLHVTSSSDIIKTVKRGTQVKVDGSTERESKSTR